MKVLLSMALLIMVISTDLCAKAGARFTRDSIEIEFENQKKVVLKNILSMGSEGGVHYSYRGYYQSIGYHKISWDAYEDHGSFALINGSNGKRKDFTESEPVLNEMAREIKYTPYIAVSKDDYHGPSALSVFTVTDSIQWVWEKVLPDNNCWKFGKIVWLDTALFHVEKRVWKEKANISTSVIEQVKLINGKWILEENWKTDSNCNWIVPKSGSKTVK